MPIATLAGSVGEAMENSSALLDKTQVWDNLSNALVLIAGANHELNMCRRNKVDLNKIIRPYATINIPLKVHFPGQILLNA